MWGDLYHIISNPHDDKRVVPFSVSNSHSYAIWWVQNFTFKYNLARLLKKNIYWLCALWIGFLDGTNFLDYTKLLEVLCRRNQCWALIVEFVWCTCSWIWKLKQWTAGGQNCHCMPLPSFLLIDKRLSRRGLLRSVDWEETIHQQLLVDQMNVFRKKIGMMSWTSTSTSHLCRWVPSSGLLPTY